MLNRIKIVMLLSLLLICISISSQENAPLPERTPEQEALKQTEKLKQEIDLTPEQLKQIYEINLRYARERQVSNTRSKAMERIKNKNIEMQRVLTENQYNQLQNKRYIRPSSVPTSTARNTLINSATLRSSSDYRQNPSYRTNNTDVNLSSTNRSSNPGTNSASRTEQGIEKSASGSSHATTSTTTRPQSVAPSSSNSSNSTSTPSRNSTTPSNTTRR